MSLLLFSIAAVLSQQTVASLLGHVGFINVTSKLGVITGVQVDLDTLNHTVYRGKADVFLGIPYAQPPTGINRFQLPQPISAWTTPLNATAYSTKCPQAEQDLASGPDLVEDENCLYMNIYRPTGTLANSTLPVMIWLFGGGFTGGSLIEYSPTEGIITNLVSRGVIVVTINYRLGIFGFFTTYTDAFPSNLGLRDQVAAFKWVRSNIDSFGGDPTKVTIFGESAGACSVSMHTVSPLSKGTFDQGIIESGALAGLRQYCLQPSSNIGAPDNANLIIAKQLCQLSDLEWQKKSFDGLSSCLRPMSWQTIMNITKTLNLSAGPGIDGPGGFLPDNPENLVKSRQNIPMIIGANRDEGATGILFDLLRGASALAYNEQSFHAAINDSGIADQTGGQSMKDVVLPLLDLSYRQSACPMPLSSNDSSTWIHTISEVISDIYTRSVALREAKLWRDASNNSQVYLYNFEYSGDAIKFYVPGFQPNPVIHTEELSYVFIWEAFSFFDLNNVTASDRAMINFMGTMWTNFAKYGDPTPNSVRSALPFKWLPFDATNNYLSINNDTIEMKANYYPKADQIFNQIIPNIVEKVQQSALTPTPTTESTHAATTSSAVTYVSSFLTLIFSIAIVFSRIPF
uniref:Carboxylic ester hydrolase n=1 Tax=Plectus sambesii TaxID=2011161 RepID=A0A914VBY0_9BILA